MRYHCDTDEKPCEELVIATFSDVRHLVVINRETNEVSTFTPETTLINASAVTVDQSNGFLFFADAARKEIWRKNFKTGEDSQIIRQLDSGGCLCYRTRMYVNWK